MVLISGRGSNLLALLVPTPCHYQVVGVISNVADAAGLAHARQARVPTQTILHGNYADRSDFDSALARQLDRWQADYIVLAGFMRILSSDLVERYAGRMINIHPSLLPKYPGLGTHARVLQAGDREHGASVHFVTAELDGGPVIAQVRMPVLDHDTDHSLASRLLPLEHHLLRWVVDLLATGRIEYGPASTITLDGQTLPAPLQYGPADLPQPDTTGQPAGL